MANNLNTSKGLLVWLSCVDEQLINKGLSGGVFTGSATYTADGGKLGKGYRTGFSNESNILVSSKDISTGTSTTIAAWVKAGSTTLDGNSRGFIALFDHRTFQGITMYPIGSKINVQIGNGSLRIRYVSEHNIPTNTWTHIAAVYENLTIKIYINGVLDTTKSTITMSPYTGKVIIGRWSSTYTDYYSPDLCVNDIRIYSYALSPQEIKEISRGLVGHWLGNDHLVLYSIFKNKTWTQLVSSTSPQTTTNNNSYPFLYGRTITFQANHTYLFAARATTTGNCTVSWNGGWGMSNIHSGSDASYATLLSPTSECLVPANSINYPCAYILKMKLEISNDSTGVDVRTHVTSGSLTLNNCMIIDLTLLYGAGNEPTSYAKFAEAFPHWYYPFTEGSTPPLAFLSDISGRHLDLEVKGSGITLNTNTPRYDKCLSFDGNGYLETNNLNINSSEPHTLSFWFYPKTDGLMICSFNNGLNLYTSYRYISLNNGGDGASNRFGSWLFTLNTWYHIAITFNGSTARLYVNGEDKGTAPTYRPLNGPKMIIGAYINGTSYRYTGMLSDIRLYATALDTTAIQELKALGH